MSGTSPFAGPYFGEYSSFSSSSSGTFLPVLGALCPSICVEFDYLNDPTSATITWTDITPYLVAYSRNPVRTNEFDQPGPATASLTLRNDDSRFTPDNPSSPYSGGAGLKPYRRIRVRAQWAGVIYNRFWGYVTDWPQSWDQAGRDQYVTLNLVDNLIPLETYDLQGQSFSSKLSGAAIQDVLTAAGVMSSNLDPGVSTIVSTGGALGVQSFALQRLKDISASENGVCYADGSGVVNFHDRHRRITNGPSSTVQATIGDSGGSEIPFTAPQPTYGDVWPIVNVTPNGGSVQSATSAAGVASFFNRTLNFPTGGTYLVSNTAEALAAAQYLSNRYSLLETRVPDVTLIGTQNTALWPTILNLDTSTKVLFKRHYLINGVSSGPMTLTEFVEGYGDDVQIGKDWRVHVALSPADTQSYWVLGDSTYGLLGTTTRLGY